MIDGYVMNLAAAPPQANAYAEGSAQKSTSSDDFLPHLAQHLAQQGQQSTSAQPSQQTHTVCAQTPSQDATGTVAVKAPMCMTPGRTDDPGKPAAKPVDHADAQAASDQAGTQAILQALVKNGQQPTASLSMSRAAQQQVAPATEEQPAKADEKNEGKSSETVEASVTAMAVPLMQLTLPSSPIIPQGQPGVKDITVTANAAADGQAAGAGMAVLVDTTAGQQVKVAVVPSAFQLGKSAINTQATDVSGKIPKPQNDLNANGQSIDTAAEVPAGPVSTTTTGMPNALNAVSEVTSTTTPAATVAVAQGIAPDVTSNVFATAQPIVAPAVAQDSASVKTTDVQTGLPLMPGTVFDTWSMQPVDSGITSQGVADSSQPAPVKATLSSQELVTIIQLGTKPEGKPVVDLKSQTPQSLGLQPAVTQAQANSATGALPTSLRLGDQSGRPLSIEAMLAEQQGPQKVMAAGASASSDGSSSSTASWQQAERGAIPMPLPVQGTAGSSSSATGTAAPVAPQAVLEQIGTAAQHLRGEQREITLRLDPPELGAIQLKITSHSSGEMTARIATSNPTVRDLLDSQLPELRRVLTEAGVNIGQCSISLGMQTPEGGQNFGQFMQQQRSAQPPSALSTGGQTNDNVVSELAARVAVSNQMVDYFA